MNSDRKNFVKLHEIDFYDISCNSRSEGQGPILHTPSFKKVFEYS